MKLDDVREGMRVAVKKTAARRNSALRRYIDMAGIVTKIYATPFAPVRIRFDDGDSTQVYADEIKPAGVQV